MHFPQCVQIKLKHAELENSRYLEVGHDLSRVKSNLKLSAAGTSAKKQQEKETLRYLQLLQDQRARKSREPMSKSREGVRM